MRYLFIILVLFQLTGCKVNRLPKERLSQFTYSSVKSTFNENDLEIFLGNPLYVPLRLWIYSNDDQLKPILDEMIPLTLSPKKDTVLKIKVSNVQDQNLSFSLQYGDISKPLKNNRVSLPFKKGKSYKLIQGNNSTPTHNKDRSRYAFDFGLSTGDTICAATDGYVVGVIEGYKYGGPDPKWRDFGNFITIYDPSSGLFTQYAHLKHQGSFVQVNDKISVGQAIGLSGMTGYTSIEHLHFNCLKPVDSEAGLISTPIDSIGNYKVSELKRNEMIKNE